MTCLFGFITVMLLTPFPQEKHPHLWLCVSTVQPSRCYLLLPYEFLTLHSCTSLKVFSLFCLEWHTISVIIFNNPYVYRSPLLFSHLSFFMEKVIVYTFQSEFLLASFEPTILSISKYCSCFVRIVLMLLVSERMLSFFFPFSFPFPSSCKHKFLQSKDLDDWC